MSALPSWWLEKATREELLDIAARACAAWQTEADADAGYDEYQTMVFAEHAANGVLEGALWLLLQDRPVGA